MWTFKEEYKNTAIMDKNSNEPSESFIEHWTNSKTGKSILYIRSSNLYLDYKEGIITDYTRLKFCDFESKLKR